MRIVLSRKGFDSGNGGVASPILPDGRLVPLPIPATADPHTYDEVRVNGVALGPLVEDLTRGGIQRTHRCHFDPDLDARSVRRLPGWRPALGQINAAQGHLTSRAIGKGDLFLFFGWFRRVERINAQWRYIREAPDLHVIYGWMQVGEVISLANEPRPSLRLAAHADHPHVTARTGLSNTLYIARDRLRLSGIRRAGGGLFERITTARVLTDADQSKRSIWRLPAWFHPDNGTTMSYHSKRSRWTSDGDSCLLACAARGQEFVISPPSLEVATSWLETIFD